MAKISIRYFTNRPKRAGMNRYYWQPSASLRRAGWKLTRLSDIYSEALQQAQDINSRVDEWRAGQLKGPLNSSPGTVDALIESYKNSREYKDLSERTAKDYLVYLRIISDWTGDKFAISITAKMVQDLYETLYNQKPRKASLLISVIRLLFNYAERQSLVPKNSNPATKPKLRYKAPKGKLWSPGAIKTFVAAADSMDYYSIGTAVMLNEWLGQRKGDIINLQMSAYQNGRLRITQSKTGESVELAIDEVPHLKTRIEEQIRQNKARNTPGLHLIQQSHGAKFTQDRFGKVFIRIRDEASTRDKAMRGLIFKDLRHTAITRLSENGGTLSEIAAVTGHSFKSAQTIVDRYNVRTASAARNAFIKRRTGESTQ